MFKSARGRRLSSIEVHDIVCKIADVVVSGGVRRSALISLSNLSDLRMRSAKNGQWWVSNPQRALSNNSVAYTEKPNIGIFMKEWLSLYESKSGERGIFNRVAALNKVKSIGRRKYQLDTGKTKRIIDNDSKEKVEKQIFKNIDFGCNPCSEIILRSCEFCNLSEVIVRADDDLESLKQKVKMATILGTMQATLTKFRFINKKWRKNCEEEALLGVSMTGIMDNKYTNGKEKYVDKDDKVYELKDFLMELKEVAIETNKEWAGKLGINVSAALTCTKPSGCRPFSALTATNKGLFTLEELLKNHSQNTEWNNMVNDISVYQGDELNKITKTYKNGLSKTIKIKLSYNLEIESTLNHKWYVNQHYSPTKLKKYNDINKWIKADQLKQGDILNMDINSYKNTTSYKFNDIEPIKHNCTSQIKQPIKMNNDIAWLLGYLWGDGSQSPLNSRLRFTDEYIYNLKKVQKVLKEQFGLNVKIHKASQERKAYTLEIGSQNLWKWFKANKIWKYEEKGLSDIPICVRGSSYEHIIAWFAGLIDADGCVHTTPKYKNNCNKYKLTIATAYDKFAKHIQDVSWCIGLCLGRSLNSKGKNLQKEKHIWLLGTTSVTSIDTIKKLINNSNKMKLRNDKFTKNDIWFTSSNANHRRITGRIETTTVNNIEIETYDIEIENKHWYYSGCVKSHNSVSQLCDTASGIHARYAPYYIRTVRIDKKDPIGQFLIDAGIPCEDDFYKPDHQYVFSFPIKSPESSIMRNDMTAIEQLEFCEIYNKYWCEHKISVTINVKEHEWMEVGAWIYKNFDNLSGVSFLPSSDHIYKQAPYTECSKEEYEKALSKMPKDINWSDLKKYEKEDNTVGSHTLACSGNNCEVVDLISSS